MLSLELAQVRVRVAALALQVCDHTELVHLHTWGDIHPRDPARRPPPSATHNVAHGMQHIQSTRRVTRATKRSCPLLPTLVRWAHAAPPRAERACVRAPECVRPFGSKNRNRGGRGGRVEGCRRQGTPVSNAAGDDRLGLLLERAHTERKGASRVGTECVEAHLVAHLQRTRVGTAVVLCARLRAFVRWWGSGREGGDCGRRGRAAQHQILRQSHNRPFEPEQRAAQGRENGWEGG